MSATPQQQQQPAPSLQPAPTSSLSRKRAQTTSRTPSIQQSAISAAESKPPAPSAPTTPAPQQSAAATPASTQPNQTAYDAHQAQTSPREEETLHTVSPAQRQHRQQLNDHKLVKQEEAPLRQGEVLRIPPHTLYGTFERGLGGYSHACSDALQRCSVHGGCRPHPRPHKADYADTGSVRATHSASGGQQRQSESVPAQRGQIQRGLAQKRATGEAQLRGRGATEAVVALEQGFVAFDGAVNEAEVPKGGEEGREGVVKPLGVKERIKALDARAAPVAKAPVKRKAVPSMKKPILASSGDSTDAGDVPFVFPLHVQRFVRRSANGTPVRPETPLYRSQPDHEPMIHAPKPTKSIPILINQPPTPTLKRAPITHTTKPELVSTPRNDRDGTAVRTVAFNDRPRVSPAAFLHGTRDKCVRHGRKPVPAQSAAKATKTMMERSRAGTYIPTGLLKRTNIEATSPWVVPNQSLTQTKGADEACPDCVTELGIRRREAGQQLNGASAVTAKRSTDAVQSAKLTIDGAGVRSTNPPAKFQASSQSHVVRSASIDSISDCLIVSRDLGEGLDAAIFECGGELEQVIINSRFGRPVLDSLQNLSRDLQSVSHALAFAGAGEQAAARHTTHGRTVIAAACTSEKQREHSLPELMTLIDKTAAGYQKDEDYTPVPRTAIRDSTQQTDSQSLLSSDEVHRVLQDGHASPLVTQMVYGERFHDYEELQNQHTEAGNLPTTKESRPSLSSTGPTSPSQLFQIRNVSPEVSSPPNLPTSQQSSKSLAVRSTAGSPLTPSAASLAAPQKPSQSTVTPSISGLLHPLATPFSTPIQPKIPAIAKVANPYHHAPEAPRDLMKAKWADKKVQEAQQVMRNAMRMEKNKAVEEAARMERGVRRQKVVMASTAGKVTRALLQS